MFRVYHARPNDRWFYGCLLHLRNRFLLRGLLMVSQVKYYHPSNTESKANARQKEVRCVLPRLPYRAGLAVRV